jgi:aspartokinase
MNLQVHKFGGASLADAKLYKTCAQLLMREVRPCNLFLVAAQQATHLIVNSIGNSSAVFSYLRAPSMKSFFARHYAFMEAHLDAFLAVLPGFRLCVCASATACVGWVRDA